MPVHPNDHVNMAQSSNDAFPSAMYIAAANVKQRLIPAVKVLRDAITAKAEEWKEHCKNRSRPQAGRDAPDPGSGVVGCTPEQAYNWSNSKAIYAAGVQFPPEQFNGQTFLPGQANNFYIFPAVGMAILRDAATRVTDEMFIEAARAVADQVPSELMSQGLLYPLQANVLEAEIRTAARVAKLVFDSGLARVKRLACRMACHLS